MRCFRILTALAFLFFATSGFSQIGIGTTVPDPSAVLELVSNNKGFLPTRVALTSTSVSDPIINAATGLLVYNTATAGTSPNNVTPGYYYWNGSAWYALSKKGNAPGDMQYWNGTQWINVAAGITGSALIMCNGVPTWGGCPDTTLTISPNNNANEVSLASSSPTSNGASDTQLTIGTWTVNSAPVSLRAFLKFDYTLPANAVIKSAKINLYAMPNPHQGNLVDAHFGTANSWYIQRVTAAWSGTSLTWNNQPATSATNQVTVPNSTSASQANEIDVTQLLKDMQQFGNNGFLMRLTTENYYNIRQYISSYNSDVTKHPKLTITYNYSLN